MSVSKASLEHWHRQTIPDIFPKTYLTVAEEHGADSERILSEVGLSRDRLNNAQQPLTMLELEQLVAAILLEVPVQGLGLAVGRHLPPTAFGNVGYALLCSPTLADAIAICERFWPLIAKGLALTVYDEGEYRVLEVKPFNVVPEIFHQLIVESTLSSFHRAFRILIGNVPDTGQIWFSSPAPTYADKISEVLGEVSYQMAADQYRVPRHLLTLPVSMSNPSGYQLALAQCENEEALAGLSDVTTSQRVQAQLGVSANGYPSIEVLADKLHMTARTLRRRLANEGTSYSELLDSGRRREAIHYLANPDFSIQKIADLLGYADPANFSRAFKQWTGYSPSQYRKTYYASSS